MAVHPWKADFSAGEITEKLDARIDWAKYASASHCIENFVVQPQGGIARRAGLAYVAEVKDSSKKVRLQAFKFSVDQTYVIEFGQGYARFYTDRAQLQVGGLPVEIAMPYQEADLPDLRTAQSADVMYLAHPDYPPAKIERVTQTSFRYVVVAFNPPPTTEQPITPQATLTLAATTGHNIAATTDAPAFLAGDVGRTIFSGGGRASIITFLTSQSIQVDVYDDFGALVFPQDTWFIDGSPQAALTVGAGSPAGVQVTLALDKDGFRTSDVGSYILVFGGLIKITAVTNATNAIGVIINALIDINDPITPAPAGSWTLEIPAWSNQLGYPAVVVFHQDRLCFMGWRNEPDGFAMSQSSDYENFGGGAAANNAIQDRLGGGGVDLIRWAISTDHGLVVGTTAAEWAVQGDLSTGILKPGAVVCTRRALEGSEYSPEPLDVGSVLFVKRGGNKLIEMTYEFAVDKWISPSISLTAEHLWRDGIIRIDRVTVEDSVVVAIRTDGVLLTDTYEPIEKLKTAWAHQTTMGNFESVAVIGNFCKTGEEVWVVVQRMIGSQTKRYIELFDGALNTDSAVVYSGGPVQMVSGVGHLVGTTATVIADGVWYFVPVFGDTVQLESEASDVEIGLKFDSTWISVRPEVQTSNGTSQGRRKHWNQRTVRWYCTSGTPKVNGDNWHLPEGSTTPYTGDTLEHVEGWGLDGRITVIQATPFPCTILGVGGSIQVED